MRVKQAAERGVQTERRHVLTIRSFLLPADEQRAAGPVLTAQHGVAAERSRREAPVRYLALVGSKLVAAWTEELLRRAVVGVRHQRLEVRLEREVTGERVVDTRDDAELLLIERRK